MCFRRITYSNIDWIYNLIESELKLIAFIWLKTWRNLLVHQALPVLSKETTMCNCSYKFFRLCFKNWAVQHFAQSNIEKLFLNFFSLVPEKTNISCNFPLKLLACFVHSLLCHLALFFIPGADTLMSLKKRTIYSLFSYSLHLWGVKCCFVDTQTVRTCVCRALQVGKIENGRPH